MECIGFATGASLDFRALREDFPTLRARFYFASQCLGPYPRSMVTDLRAYERSLALRSRAIGEWTERWSEMHELTERLLEAPRGSVFLRDSATAAQAAIASALKPEGERKRIVIGSGDFHSSRYLWQSQVKRGFDVVEVDSYRADTDDPRVFTDAIDERTRIVALSLVSPRTGALIDARAIADAAHRVGAIVVLDAFQAVGVVPVRVIDLKADVIVGGFHKWVGGGGTGIAFGYVSPSFASKLDPAYPGWLAHRDLLGFEDRFAPASGAKKLQQGMPAMEPVYTSRAGVKWIIDTGIDAIRARSLALTERIIERGRESGLVIRTPNEKARRGGMVCIDTPNASELVTQLAEIGIDVDSRPGAGLRIGPHACVTEEECDAVIDAIRPRLR